MIVFGLTEKNTDDLDCKITALLGKIEKPQFEALRDGMVSADWSRPVKVSLRNWETVHRLLKKVKKLKTTNTYKRVYILPNRPLEEREKHRLLV